MVPQKEANGYRIYQEADLNRLQVIRFYKYLGFSLGEIAELLSRQEDSLLPHLERQLLVLEKEKRHLDDLITTLQQTILTYKGELTMTMEEKFAGFTYEDHIRYHDQALAQYGQEVMEDSQARQKGREEAMMTTFNQIFKDFALHQFQGIEAKSPVNLDLAKQLHTAIREYAFDCSLEVFGYIGKGYVAKPEFKTNIDKFGQGLADYVSQAISHYIQQEN